MTRRTLSPVPTIAVALLLVALLPALQRPARAALADLADLPIGVNTSNGKPNVLFIMDDSGSMAWDYMPDILGYWSGSDWVPYSNKYGYRAAQCNGVAYNPSTVYKPPVYADGSPYPNASYPSASNDGYVSTATTTDLSSNYYYTYTGSEAARAWTYQTNGAVDTSTNFYKQCMSDLGSAPGSSVFTKVNVSTLSATEKTNYANWWSYYRTRYLTMRTAAGQAFAKLDANYRVGFMRINDANVSSTNFLNTDDFTTTQKSSFFNLLYTAPQSGGTPLRQALSVAGRYYAKVLSGQTFDPMVNSSTDSTLNSCRRNYAILSTDGYWNSGGGVQLDNSTAIGNEDYNEVRPMKDSSTTVITTTTDNVQVDRRTTTGTSTTTTVERRTVTDTHTCTYGWWWWTSTGREVTSYEERRTGTAASTRVLVEDLSSGTRNVVVTTNGVTTSNTTSSLGTTTTTVSDTTTPTGTTTWGSWSSYGGTSVVSACGASSATVGKAYSSSSTVSSTAGWSGTPTASTVTGMPTSTTTSTTTTTNGDTGTLADVAEYYYVNDLRTDIANKLAIKAGSIDTATHQHMTTFTLGFGLKGVLSYDINYLTQLTGDYVNLKNGTKEWPVPSGTLGYSEDATHIDDLWHAAVNGRGRYFSAQNPDDVASALTLALNTIAKDSGTGSAAATSSLMPTAGGDDLVFLPSFMAARWSGDLKAFHFSYDADGKITGVDTANTAAEWSAAAKLDAMTLTNRKVYFNKVVSGTPTLTALTYANLPTGTIKSSFDNRCTVTTPFAQCASMTATAKTKVTGTNLVAYLTGDRSLEITAAGGDNSVFRTRDSRLGDIVNASPVYVAGPAFRYTDSGYSSFKSSKAARKRVVYAAGNDGMLHAFATGTSPSNSDPDSTGGTELWAFVPTAALEKMAQLGDSAYDSNHQFFVDGTPVVGDVYDGSKWRTILVGGLGKGGKSYYALDITDPDAPSLLWEITTATSGFANLGYTYGNPIITKLKNGTWTVIFSSGINNVGDGIGRVHVVNAVTGASISTVSTGAGGTGTPSNLVKLNAWLVSDLNNTVKRVYGGDMLGNFWRFDVDDNIAPTGNEATLMGVAQTSSSATPANTRQPITVKPVLVEVLSNNKRIPLVTFGTGRYLGDGDMSDATPQTIYVLKDTLGEADTTSTTTPKSMYGVMRATSTSKFVQYSMASDHTVTYSGTAFNWETNNGWFVDLDRSTRERIVIDPSYLQGAVVAFSSSIPNPSSCDGMGSSYLYKLDLGKASVAVMSYSDKKMNVGVTTYLDKTQGSRTKSSILATKENQSVETVAGEDLPAGMGKIPRRAAWRELVD